MAVVAWKNSLVLHDWSKMTTLFIHIYPPIVTYCMRWYPDEGFSICPNESCNLHLQIALVWPVIFYIYWQITYIVKTEVVDRNKLKKDKDLVTSVRWLSVHYPHPIYKWFIKKGYKGNPAIILISCQLLYTVLTLLPTLLLYQYRLLHGSYLSLIFLISAYTGADYYFKAERPRAGSSKSSISNETTSPTKADAAQSAATKESPTQRTEEVTLEQKLESSTETAQAAAQTPELSKSEVFRRKGRLLTSPSSFFSFCLFFGGFIFSLYALTNTIRVFEVAK